MAQELNQLQLYFPKSWAGLTTENHLATAYMEHPQLISDVISRVFGLNQYHPMLYAPKQGFLQVSQIYDLVYQ